MTAQDQGPPAPLSTSLDTPRIRATDISSGIRSQLSGKYAWKDMKTIDPKILKSAADALDLFCRYMADMPIDTDSVRALVARAARHTCNFSIYNAASEEKGFTTPEAIVLVDCARRESHMASTTLKMAREMAEKQLKEWKAKGRVIDANGYLMPEPGKDALTPVKHKADDNSPLPKRGE